MKAGSKRRETETEGLREKERETEGLTENEREREREYGPREQRPR